MFDTDFWNQVRDLFARASELGPHERREFLEQACDGNPELRVEVESLLAAEVQGLRELEVSPVASYQPEGDNALPRDAISGYSVLEEIHRGGQGVVYRALQHSTKREVAVKLMLEGRFASSANKKRFEREIELASNLRHPGVVPIFDSGNSGGLNYYSMAFIQGERLDDYVRSNQLPLRQILQLFVRICNAVDYAHQKGVIHRDLKPSNVLVDASGNPHVLDFGLAKVEAYDNTDDTAAVTMTGQVMGTLNYMSPEQAAGRTDQIDLRSDVYSLGVVLYHLLAGSLPYPLDSSLAENLSTIQNAVPRKLTFYGQSISGEASTIVLKAMSKEKARRYATAGALGDDIERYLTGYPIEAKRDSVFYVLSKTVRRYRVAASVVASFLLLIAASSVVAWWLYLSADTAWRQERETSAQLRETSAKHLEASDNYRLASEKYQRERDIADQLRKQSVQKLYYAKMILAGQAANSPGGNQVVADLTTQWIPQSGATDHRDWEWYYLASQCDREHSKSLNEIIGLSKARWSHDGKRLAVGGTRTLYLFNENATNKPIFKAQHKRELSAIDWNHDDTRLATGSSDNSIYIWDTSNASLEPLIRLPMKGRIDGLQWSPDGKELAVVNHLGAFRIWNMENHERITKLDGLTSGTLSLSWHPSGETLAITDGGAMKVIKKNGEEIAMLPTSSFEIRALKWNPYGTRIAAVTVDGSTIVWNMETGQELWKHVGAGTLEDVVWISNGDSLLATASQDRSVRIFNASKGYVVREIKGHGGAVRSVDWHPDGDRLVTTNRDGLVRIWPTANQGHSHAIRYYSRYETKQVECSPDGTTVACVGIGPKVKHIRIADEQVRHFLHPNNCHAIAWKPGEQVLASAADDQKIRLWKANADTPFFVFEKHRNPDESGRENTVFCLDWSSDGKYIVSGDQGGNIIVWSSETGEVANRFKQHHAKVEAVQWQPNGSLVVSGSALGRVLIWDVHAGEVRREIRMQHLPNIDIRWNEQGDQFATSTRDGLAKIWQPERDEPLFVLKGHAGPVRCVRWHPNGTRIATSSDDGTIRLWSTKTGEEVLTIHASDDPVCGIAWSRDGQQLFSASDDGIIRVWDASHTYQSLNDEHPSDTTSSTD